MKKFLGIVCSLVLILVAGVTFSACGNSDSKVTISASETEFELVIGTEEQSKNIEFIVENFGNGSGQVNFSVEEDEKGTVSLDPSYMGNGKTVLTVSGLKRGTARIVATSLQGSAKVVLTVRVIQPITGLSLKTDYVNKLYVIRGGELNLSQRAIWAYAPSETNQTELEFSIIGNSQGCEIVDGKLVVGETCGLSSLTIKAQSAHNSEIYEEFEVKILQPIEVVLQIDGKRVVESVENSSSQILNFLEIFPRELDGSVYPNSKELVLAVKAGTESETLSIEKLFSSEEAKFSVEQTGYSYDAATKLHIYKFLVQASSNEAGKIDSVVFNVSYEGFKAGESDYSVSTTKLNINSYNKPLSVEVNGESGSTEIDVFENSADFSNGKMIEFSILPGNVKLSENTITIWAEDFSNLPISLYKLNSTRTGYVCVFGYDQKGIAVGALQNGVRYASISSGTKLYAFINSNYNSLLGTNKTAKVYAQASGFCDFTASSSARALTTIDFVINPNAKNISLAEKNEHGILTKIDLTSIFVEIGKQVETYIAIDPNTFTIGSNSVIKIANDRIATVGELVEYASDTDFVYGKFTIDATKVGSSTLTIVLSDGKSKDFNLVVVSPLEKIEMDLEDVTYGGNVIESDIVPYKNITDKEISVGETSPFVALNKLSIANSGGSGIQLVKTLTPSTAQYYLRCEFADFTLPESSTLQSLTLDDVKTAYGEDFDNIWGDSSNIINTSRLSNLSIIEAKNSGAEGNVLVRIAVYAMNSNGEYGTEPVGYFYYLINFFVPVRGLSLTNGTLELYTYNTIGDKFVESNGINKSIKEFSVTVNPVNQGLTPTYLNNLEIFVNGATKLTNSIFEERSNVVYISKGGSIVSGIEGAALKIARTKDGNTFTFKVQAYSGAGNYILALVLSEVNESKRFTAISRVVVEDAVEITDIDVVNASDQDPITFNNVVKSGEEDEATSSPFELELIYNIYGPAGKEITNSSLEFEIYWNKLSEKDHFIDENGEKVYFASISEGKLTIQRAAYDYSAYYEKSEEEREGLDKEELKEFVKFGGEGYIRIYPTSNYFLSTNGWNGEDPIVEIPLSVSDGNEVSYYILSEDDLYLLSEYPSSNFELRANVVIPSTYVPVEEFSGTLSGGTNGYYIATWCPIFKKITSTGVFENIWVYYSAESEQTDKILACISEENETTYFGAIANINEGTIRNVGGSLEIASDLAFNYAGLKTIVNTRTGLLDSGWIMYLPLFTTGNLTSSASYFDAAANFIGGEVVKYTGGMVGINKGTIESTKDDLYYCGTICGANVGGIAGVNEGVIKNTNFYGVVYGIESAGGVCALNSGTISNCDVLTTSLFNIGVYILSTDAYSYSETPIEFAVGGIAAKSVGGVILNCKAEASSNSKFDPTILGSLFASLDKESYCTVNGKPLGIGFQTQSIKVDRERKRFDLGDERYYIDDLTNPTKITYTLNGENFSVDVVDNKFTLGNKEYTYEKSGYNYYVIQQASFASGTIYAGGLVGILSDGAKIQESIFNGSLSIDQVVSGGLVGKLVGDGNSSTTSVENCYAIVTYDESNNKYGFSNGQFIGFGDLSEIKNCYVSSNGTFNNAGQGSGYVVSSYVKKSAQNVTKFFELSDIYKENSVFKDPDMGMGIDLDYGLTLNDYLNLSWANLYQNGKIDYTIDTTSKTIQLSGTITMSGLETDPVSTFDFSFSFEKNNYEAIEPIKFTYKDIGYKIELTNNSSYCYLCVSTDGDEQVEFTSNGSTYSRSISFNRDANDVSTATYYFLIDSAVELIKNATDSAYIPLDFTEEISGEDVSKRLSPSILEMIYAKYYFVWIYNNFDAIVSNEEIINALDGEMTPEQYICGIFGLDSSLSSDEIKDEIRAVLTSTVLPQLNAGLADLKNDVTRLKTSLASFKTAFIGYLKSKNNPNISSYEQAISNAQTLLENGIGLTEIEEITFENISEFKLNLDYVSAALIEFTDVFMMIFEESDDNEEFESDVFALDNNSVFEILYSAMFNYNISTFSHALKLVDLSLKADDIPTSLSEFKDAGWDIESSETQSNSVWIFNDGELPTLRNKQLAKRVSKFDVEIKENKKSWISYKGTNSTSLVMFNYSVLGELSALQQSALNNLNSHNISDIFTFTNINGVEGETMSSNLFTIQSSNKSVIQVVGGKIIVVGTGKATLTIKPLYEDFTFTSNLEQNVTIYVINPLGETQIFQGVSANTNPINNSEISIYKNELNYLTIATKKTISLGNEVFNFVTNAMGYTINLEGKEIGNYFELNGLTAGADTDKFAEGTLTVKPGENVTSEAYKFVVKSYLQKENQNFGSIQDSNLTQFVKDVNKILESNTETTFTAKVLIKSDRILISIKEAEIDPSSTAVVDFELQTTNSSDEVIIVIRDEKGDVVWVSKDITIDGTEYKTANNSKIFDVNPTSDDYKNGKIKGRTLISVLENQRNEINETKVYTVTFGDVNFEQTTSLKLKIKPQEILNVTYVHNNRTEDSTENGIKLQPEPSSVLMPGDSGLLTIGLYPTYSNFKRIVLTSQIVDGQNYILLEQMYKSGEYYIPVSSTTGYSSVRDGNVLTINKPENPSLATDNGNIYVRTKMLDTVSEGLYFPINITIICEDEDGNEYVSKSETITLLSETIDGAQITINGSKDATLTRGNTFPIKVSVNENQSLASISPVNFNKDATAAGKYDFVSTYFDTSEYEIVDGRKIYSGTITIGLDAEINDDGVFQLQTIVNKVINGKYETAIDTIEIRVVDFLVEGVKIKGNADDDNVFNTPAAIEKELEFEFVFSETPEIIEAGQEDAINRINKAKEEFAKNVSLKQYFSEKQQYVINTDRNFVIKNEEGNSSLTSTTNNSLAYDLFYTSDMTQYINSQSGEIQESKYFNIKFNGDKVGSEMSATKLKIIGKAIGSVGMTIKIGYRVPGLDFDQYILYNFVINVQVYSDEDKPTPIENGEQFVEYLTSGTQQYGETNFILMDDIVLENFAPIETTNFLSLDGNNKVITIKNFSYEDSAIVSLGLFQNVSSNSTIKNLVVNYGNLSNIVLGENVRTFNFGGIAVTNSGTIYNCEVVSLDLENNSPSTNGGIKVYFGEEGKSKGDDVSANIAGLVVTNNSSVTNSRVGAKTDFREKNSLNQYVSKVENFKQISYVDNNVLTTEYKYGQFNIVGQGNVSGFAITNNGVISSSYFANGKIVNQTASGAQSETAGFVISNMVGATIFGSYVEGIKLDTDLSVNITGGGIVAQGICAGFAYQNYGSISDCYTNIRLAGESTGRIVSGFVYNNQSSGIVSRCFSASTIVGQLTTQMPFSGKNAREEIMQKASDGLVNCYYLVKKQDTESVLEEKYNTGAIALQISTLQSASFYGFTLTTGRNENDGVWSWDGILPQLVSANQKAISVRRVIKNYSSLISEGASIETLNVYPYISGFEYGTQNNPIIIRSADEFNRVFGQETGLVKNAYYAISQMYNKDLGIVYGSYRLVSSINFDKLTYVENVKISSSIMELAKNNSNSGSFDGNALTISNIEISLDNQNSVGLFSKITSGGVVKNVNLTVKSIATGNRGVYAGAVAGYVSNSSLANISVEPVNETGENRSKISGQNIVGGIAGAVVGNSTVSNLTSSVSVVSGNAQANKDINNYILNVLRNSATVINGVVSDKNKDYSFAGGVIGILDIYEDINDQSVIYSTPNAKQLTFKGTEVSVQGSVVGGVVGYNGASTYLVDSAFILSGQQEAISQRLITYGNTIGGVVGINKGDLYELRIEHSDEVQKIIEDNLQNYYNNETDVFRGNTKLFNSTSSISASETDSGDVIGVIGGIVGQMLGGEITVSYSRVDVSLETANYAGGAIGYTNIPLDLIEIYAFGDVDGKVVGGLIGKASSKISFERCVAMNFISKTNSHLLSAYEAANEFNAQGEEGGEWNLNGDKTTITKGEGENAISYSVVTLDGKVVGITLNNFGMLIGSQSNKAEYNYTITDEVYGNQVLTFMNLTIKFNSGNEESGLSLDGGISSYRGYDLDATVVNKMFLGAGWDANLWELKDGRILPSFSYGVSAKTIYIEKTMDLLKLKKYYRGDNIIIFGDDPTTSFNPYEYNPEIKSTYGTFTSSELEGLTVDITTKTITFDISKIQSLVALGDGGTFFKRFLGVMYGEFGQSQVDENPWIYKIVNITHPLFGTVKGGSISDLTFDNSGATTLYPVLANSIESRADLNYLTFTGIKIKAAKDIGAAEDTGKKYGIGIISATMNDVLSISNIAITNCSIGISDLTGSKLSIGAIAGNNLNESSSATTVLENVKVQNFTVTANSGLKLADGLMVGGFFGETSGLFEFKESQVTGSTVTGSTVTGSTVTGSTFDVGLGILDENSEYNASQVIFAGGFVGNAQGKNIIHKLDNSAQLTSDLTIKVNQAATTYAGLLFGHVGNLVCEDDQGVEFSGTIRNNDEGTPTTLVVGGAAGRVGTATIAGMKAEITANNLKTKSFSAGDSTIISAFGSLFGTVNGEAKIENVKYYEDISISGTDATETKNENDADKNAFAAGGLIGTINAGGNSVSIEGCGYYGGLTVDYSATTLYVGGLVGFSNSNVYFGKSTDGKTEMTGEIRIEQVSGVANVGGIIGFAKGSATTINDSVVTGEIIFPNNKSLSGVTLNVGSLAGSVSNGVITGNKVGGNISFNNSTITEGNVCVGGLVGSMTSGTVSGNYAWGNITLKNASLFDANNSLAFDVLTAGGLVGTTNSGKPKFDSNYSLTSLYITKTAAIMADTNIGALIGTGAISDESKDNFYCHQINLATDIYGTNCYYMRKTGDGSIINKLKESLKGDYNSYSSYSKLNPTPYSGSGNLNEGTYYYLSSNKTFSSTVEELNGHLVGDGFKIVASTTPFGTISGALSGVSFVTTSKVEGSDNGRVSQANDSDNLPNGVAKENSGVIFAVVVEARGYASLASFGNVLYAFNSGIAGANSGLIADSGVIFNAKSIIAGIANNASVEKNKSGVVRNSYTTGAVHENAICALAQHHGALINCYTSLDASSISNSYTKCENVYYDSDALSGNPLYIGSGISLTGITKKSTDYLSTQVGSATTSILGNLNSQIHKESNWSQDYRVNFGYPYLGNGAYANFTYMKKYTGGTLSSDFDVDNEEAISNETLESIQNEWKASLTYLSTSTYNDGGLLADWKIYEIHLGEKTYDKYIWIREDGGSHFFSSSKTSFPKAPLYSYSNRGKIEKNDSVGDAVVELTWYCYIKSEINGKPYIDEKPNVKVIKADAIQIPNAGKLAQLQTTSDKDTTYLSYTHQLLCSIDLTKVDSTEVDSLTSWTPIGNNANNFSGIFDGNDYVIYNIPSITATEKYCGFFGVSKGTIKNCGFVYKDNVIIKTNSSGCENPSGVVGLNQVIGKIYNVSTSGATVRGLYAGGIVSDNYGEIKNSYNYNKVNGSSTAGGVASVNYNSISLCGNFGVIEGVTNNNSYAGGIAGLQQNDADRGYMCSNCYNYGSVKGDMAGGIIGYQKQGRIYQCQNYAGINGTSDAGGIVGRVEKEGESAAVILEDLVGEPRTNSVFEQSEEYSLGEGITVKFEADGTNMTFKSDGSQYTEYSTNFEYYTLTNINGQQKYWKKEFYLKSTFGLIKFTVTGKNDYTSGSSIITFNCKVERYVVDLSYSSIEECFNSGVINSNDYAGGIAGRFLSQSQIYKAKNTGKIVGGNFAGGIVGGTRPGGISDMGRAYRCSNTGYISGGNWEAQIGNDIGVVTKCYGGGTLAAGSDKTKYEKYQNRNGDSSTDQSGVDSKKADCCWISNEMINLLYGTGASLSVPDYDSKEKVYNIYTAEQFAWFSANQGYCLALSFAISSSGEALTINILQSNKISLKNDINFSGKANGNTIDVPFYGYVIVQEGEIQSFNRYNKNCTIQDSESILNGLKFKVSSDGKLQGSFNGEELTIAYASNGGAFAISIDGKTKTVYYKVNGKQVTFGVAEEAELVDNGYNIFFNAIA